MRFVFKDNNKPHSPVLFIHGLSAHFLNMLKLQAEIVDHDYYAAMLPGHYMGDDIKVTKRKIILFAEQIVEWANNLKINNLTIIAHSLGGAITLILLRLIPEKIRCVMLVSPLTPKINFFNPKVSLIRIKKSLQLVKKFIKIPFQFKYLYQVGKSLLTGTFSRKNFLKNFFLSWFCTLEEKKHCNIIMPMDPDNFQFNKFYKSFNTFFIKNLFLIYDAFSRKSIKAMNRGIKMAAKVKIPIVYIHGAENDALTPYSETIKYFKKYYPNIQNISFTGAAHWSFIVDYPRFKKIFYQFINHKKVTVI